MIGIGAGAGEALGADLSTAVPAIPATEAAATPIVVEAAAASVAEEKRNGGEVEAEVEVEVDNAAAAAAARKQAKAEKHRQRELKKQQKAPKQVAMKRGQRGKKKKIAKKYRDQDEVRVYFSF